MHQVRHHAGIRQTGENKGMLKKGFCYDLSKAATRKVKKGCLRPIKKAKKVKK